MLPTYVYSGRLYPRISFPLQWRHNERDGVANHSRLDCLLKPFVHAQIKEIVKAPRHWPLWGEFTGGLWIPLTKGQKRPMWRQARVPISGPEAAVGRFTKGVNAKMGLGWRVIIQIIAAVSQRNCAHVTTALLAWHEHSFAVITILGSQIQEIIFVKFQAMTP